MKYVPIALSFLVVAGQADVSAAGDSPQVSASCVIGLDASAVRIELIVANGGQESLFEVTPGALMATGRGTAFVFVESAPAHVSVLSPAADASFVWSGRAFGDGSIEVATSLTARNADGSEVQIESIDCGELAVGDPDRPVPTPYRTPHPHRTRIATATATRTPTPVQVDPEPCPGDCDANGTVRLHELVTTIDIALGRTSITACRAADANGNSQIEVNELTAAIGTSLSGCTVAAEAD
jgi:hypothetical protein